MKKIKTKAEAQNEVDKLYMNGKGLGGKMWWMIQKTLRELVVIESQILGIEQKWGVKVNRNQK